MLEYEITAITRPALIHFDEALPVPKKRVYIKQLEEIKLLRNWIWYMLINNVI